MDVGLTNEVASMAGSPASDSASMKRTFTSVATVACSFCNPSRGPTSTTVTRLGSDAKTRAICQASASSASTSPAITLMPTRAVTAATEPG